MTLRLATLVAATWIALAGARAAGEESPPRPRSPLDQGRFSLSLAAGSESSFDQRYFVAAVGVGYFVLPGLELSLGAVRWFGGDPSVTKVSPQARYVVTYVPGPVKPFVGTFYNHWFIGGAYDDLDTVGARAGVVLITASGLVIGLGATYERVVSKCDGATTDCSSVYPELSISLSL